MLMLITIINVVKGQSWIMICCFYGDDNFAVGYPKANHKLIQKCIYHGLNLKIEDDLHEFLSCEIIVSNDQKNIWLD